MVGIADVYLKLNNSLLIAIIETLMILNPKTHKILNETRQLRVFCNQTCIITHLQAKMVTFHIVVYKFWQINN